MNKPHILFLANTAHPTKAVLDHINAIINSNSMIWHVVNPLLCKTMDKFDFSLFDAIGIHYSVKPYDNYYLSQALKRKIGDYRGVKFIFLQDEYQKVNHIQDFLYNLGFDLLFTLVNEAVLEKAYPDARLQSLKKIQVLTGYVSDEMKTITAPPIEAREIDVSYRGRPCEYWLGRLAHDKQLMGTEFIKHTQNKGLKLDISLEESERVYGAAWFQLLMNSKAVLGTESGASIWDFDESVKIKTKRFLRKHKGASFDVVYEQVLKPYEGNVLYNAISPRVFEAAATKTPMIMFPGDYNGICKPHQHYIVLEKDFSNTADVVEKLKDTNYLQDLADRTYVDLIESDFYFRDRLSEVVSLELLNKLKSKHTVKQRSVEATGHIEKSQEKYKNLNRIRCGYTESIFILSNFFHLLFDPRYTFFSKLNELFKGFKRYLAYLLPRLKT